MGGGSKSQREPQSSKDLAAIARDLYGKTDPLRTALIGRSAAFLGVPTAPAPQSPMTGPAQASNPGTRGGRIQFGYKGQPQPQDLPQLLSTAAPAAPAAAPDIFATPGYDFLKNTVEKQYGQARENALATTAPGGGLARVLSQIEMGRADSMIAGKSNLYDTEMNRAFSLATGTPLTTSTSALGTAGNIQAQIAMANAQQNAAAKQGIGMGTGMMLGGK